MQNEQAEKQFLRENPEIANLVKDLSLVPVSKTDAQVKDCPTNIGHLASLCEAVRRVFPSKEKLTLSRIKHFLRVEGFVPMQNGENGICFKIQGETFSIHYDGLRLCFVKSYELPTDGLSIKAMMAANTKVASDIYGVKSSFGKDEEGCSLSFTAESICSTYVDFAHQYFYYMNAINHCVSYHHEAYDSFLDQYPVDSVDQSKRRRIGF